MTDGTTGGVEKASFQTEYPSPKKIIAREQGLLQRSGRAGGRQPLNRSRHFTSSRNVWESACPVSARSVEPAPLTHGKGCAIGGARERRTDREGEGGGEKGFACVRRCCHCSLPLHVLAKKGHVLPNIVEHMLRNVNGFSTSATHGCRNVRRGTRPEYASSGSDAVEPHCIPFLLPVPHPAWSADRFLLRNTPTIPPERSD